jgi:hypothetical protein
MRSHRIPSTRAAAMLFALFGCGSGDLTLPGDQPGLPTPASLEVVSGDGQRGEPGTVLQDPVVIRVLDDSSRPVRDTPVRFSFLGDLTGAALDPPSILTDEAGRASAVVRLGEMLGEQVVVAEVVGAQVPDLRAQVTAIAVGSDGDGGGKKGGGHDHGDGD